MPDAAAHKLQETVDQITGYRKRTRKLVTGLIAVTAVSIAVAALAVYLFFRLHASQVDNCTAANQTRVQQEQLWDTVLALSAKNPANKPTAKTEQLSREFQGVVKKTYAPVDCSARYPLW